MTDEGLRKAYRDELPTVLRMAELGDMQPLKRYKAAMQEEADATEERMTELGAIMKAGLDYNVRMLEETHRQAQTKLRRDFATAAMQAYIQAGKIGAEEIAKLSYEYADAMMAAETAKPMEVGK